jgi:hypothetical protein
MDQFILSSASDWAFVGHPETLVFLIPIAAIMVGGIIALARLLLRHRERMAMIERGMHPDGPPEQDEADTGA